MRAGSQKKPYNYFNPITLILFLFLLLVGCTHLRFRNNDSTPPKKDVERSYYQNGNLEYEAEFINGKLDGTSRVWSEDGTLYSKSEYSNGQPHGVWIIFYSNGTLMHEVQYEYGQKHGTEKWYYENEQLKSEQKFSYGKPVTDMIRWNPDGSILY